MADEPQIQWRRVLVDGVSTPYKIVHQFLWTRVGADIMLDVGHFDLVEMRDAIELSQGENGPVASVNFYVTDRLFLTPTGVRSFIDGADQLKAVIRELGGEPPGQHADREEPSDG